MRLQPTVTPASPQRKAQSTTPRPTSRIPLTSPSETIVERWIVQTSRVRGEYVFSYDSESGLRVCNNIQIAKLFRRAETADSVAALFHGRTFLVLIANGEARLCSRRRPCDEVAR